MLISLSNLFTNIRIFFCRKTKSLKRTGTMPQLNNLLPLRMHIGKRKQIVIEKDLPGICHIPRYFYKKTQYSLNLRTYPSVRMKEILLAKCHDLTALITFCNLLRHQLQITIQPMVMSIKKYNFIMHLRKFSMQIIYSRKYIVT